MSRKYVFLSSGDRDLGVSFYIHPGSHAASRVEAKNSALLSNCDGYLLKPIEWPKGSRASCGVLREDSGLLLGPAAKEGPHLATMGESRGFFRAATQRVGFSTSYDGELREPVVWPQGSPVSIRFGRGSVALLLSHGRGIRPQEALKEESRGVSQLWQ